MFDVYGGKSGYNQFKNVAPGFKSFKKKLPKESLVVMEATGYYHYRLAQFLYKQSVLIGH
jgi:transposase